MIIAYNEEGYMTLQNEHRRLNLVKCNRCGEFHATDTIWIDDNPMCSETAVDRINDLLGIDE